MKEQDSTGREARVLTVIAAAKAKGEKIPPGVELIGFRNPNAGELAYAQSLAPLAAQALSRSKSQAAA